MGRLQAGQPKDSEVQIGPAHDTTRRATFTATPPSNCLHQNLIRIRFEKRTHRTLTPAMAAAAITEPSSIPRQQPFKNGLLPMATTNGESSTTPYRIIAGETARIHTHHKIPFSAAPCRKAVMKDVRWNSRARDTMSMTVLKDQGCSSNNAADSAL
jgi:hypothetical protein